MGFPPLNIKELDGSPSVYPIAIKLPNGSLTDNGDATVTLDFSSVYVPYTGATGDVDLGAYDLTATDLTLQGIQIIDVTNAEALLVRKNADAGDVFTVDTSNSRVLVGGSGRCDFQEGIIVNDAGGDSDSVIEGDGDPVLFFVDASADRVGIGTSTPSTKFHVVGNTTLGGSLTISTQNIITDTSSGSKIGTATNQKLGFFNATPIVQVPAATDLGTVLSNLGLRAAGTAYPLATSAQVKFDHIAEQTGSHTVVFDNNITISTKNIITDTSTGSQIGTASTQKLGFYGATPVVRQTGCAVPTDLATSITAITALRTALNNLGLTTVV